MKHWIQYTKTSFKSYDYKLNKFVNYDKPIEAPCLGSSSSIQFDQRLNLDNITNKAIEYLNRNKIDNFTGFIIYNTTWLKETNKVYQYIKNN